jgi:hypothetical protein
MEAKYLALYRLHGIASLPENKDLELLLLPKLNARAVLTTRPDAHCIHLDTQNALRTMILNNINGRPSEDDPAAVIQANMTSLREARSREGTGVFLIINAEDDIGELDFTYREDRDDVIWCMDAFSKTYFPDKLKKAIDGVVAAISLSLDPNKSCNISRLGDVTYAIDTESHKPIYSFSHNFSVDATVTGPLNDQTPEFVRTHAARLGEHKRLTPIVRLLVRSYETRSFIQAWSAFEIFIVVVFKDHYEQEWLTKLKSGTPSSADRYFDRLQSVMKDKYRTSDKFLVIASLLDDSAADTDASEFKQLKDLRDRFFHTAEVPETDVPVEKIQHLLRKYLRLHLVHCDTF